MTLGALGHSGAMRRSYYVHTVHLRQLPEPVAVCAHKRLAPCAACQVSAGESRRALQSPGARPALVQRAARSALLPSFRAAGQQVDSGDVQVDPENPKKLSVALPVLAMGLYTVKYRVPSVDSHIVEDQFSFTVRGSR